jgi:hypothetical protein
MFFKGQTWQVASQTLFYLLVLFGSLLVFTSTAQAAVNAQATMENINDWGGAGFQGQVTITEYGCEPHRWMDSGDITTTFMFFSMNMIELCTRSGKSCCSST